MGIKSVTFFVLSCEKLSSFLILMKIHFFPFQSCQVHQQNKHKMECLQGSLKYRWDFLSSALGISSWKCQWQWGQSTLSGLIEVKESLWSCSYFKGMLLAANKKSHLGRLKNKVHIKPTAKFVFKIDVF